MIRQLSHLDAWAQGTHTPRRDIIVSSICEHVETVLDIRGVIDLIESLVVQTLQPGTAYRDDVSPRLRSLLAALEKAFDCGEPNVGRDR